MYAKPKLSLKPSELIRRQGHATFMYDPVAINNRAHHRASRRSCGATTTRTPRARGPRRRRSRRSSSRTSPDDELRAIVGGTASEVFGFSLA